MFTGLSAFPLTPATEGGIVDTEALARLAARLVEAGVGSIGVLGSTGIYAYLNRTERRRAVKATVQVARGRVPVMVGVGALRTDDARALARDAATAGADALLMAPASYTPLSDDEVFEHYVAVASATDLPLCIYNNPGTTGFRFSAALLGRLAAVPRVAAVKMPLPSDGEVTSELASLRGGPAAALSIGYSGDWGLSDATLAGADAFYSAIAGILPREARALFEAARTGDRAEARRLDRAFQPLWDLFKRRGGLRVIYSIANHLSLCASDPPRPILPLQAEDQGLVRDALDGIESAFV